MKRIILFVTAALLFAACASPKEQAKKSLENLKEYCADGKWTNVLEEVEDITKWYESLEEEQKVLVDKDVVRYMHSLREEWELEEEAALEELALEQETETTNTENINSESNTNIEDKEGVTMSDNDGVNTDESNAL